VTSAALLEECDSFGVGREGRQQSMIGFQDAAFDVPGRSGAGANVPCNLSRNSSVNCTRMIINVTMLEYRSSQTDMCTAER
jgi:hypothetical protein